jgi:hypothetical protein
VKWRANKRQEFVIGGYTLNGNALDSILVGYYRGRDLMYAASVRAGSSGPPPLPCSPVHVSAAYPMPVITVVVPG